MQRRNFMQAALLAAGATGSGGGHAAPATDTVAEQSVAQLQAAMQAQRVRASDLVSAYLRRIQRLDRAGPRLNAVIELNPDAMAIAKALDAERQAKGPRGPLHGIPVLLKDNIATADKMLTSAGSLALTHGPAAHDAHLVTRLRAAGAVIHAILRIHCRSGGQSGEDACLESCGNFDLAKRAVARRHT